MALPADFREKYGPWALVTGASSGIGEHFARALARSGFHLLLVARRKDRLDALAAELASSCDVEVVGIELDLARADFCDALIEGIGARDVGLVINNAGGAYKGAFVGQPTESKLALLDLLCRAPLLLIDALLPRLVERGRGGVIITSSIESVRGFPWSVTYAATKAFETALGEGLWGELRRSGVDVLVLEPGATDTEQLPNSGMKAEDQMGVMSPDRVAREALEQLGNGPVFIPGRINRLLVGMLGLLPRGLAIKLAGKGMKDAIEKGKRG